MSTLENFEKMGRQAWLAGLGAYGTGWKYAVNKLDQAYVETNSLVNELISRGETIQSELQGKLAANDLFDEKITALKSKLGLGEPTEEERIAELSAKVDALVIAITELMEKATLTEKKSSTTKVVKAKPAVESLTKSPARTKAKSAKVQTKSAKAQARPKAAAKPKTLVKPEESTTTKA